MSVFVAEGCFDYEGCSVIGVFSTADIAKPACDGENYDSFIVTAFDIDSKDQDYCEVRFDGGEWRTEKR